MSEIELLEEGGSITRREFTAQSVLALLGGFIITVTEACGSSSSVTTPSPTAPSDITASISANHGHVATVTGAQITADLGVTLNIQGQATHNHTVDLSSTDLTNLKNRQTVAITSSTNSGHQHTVTFTPA